MPDIKNLNEDSVYSFSDMSQIFKDKKRPKSIEPGETYTIEVEMFRSGKFKHPWYGDLDFTEQYLNDIVRNFNNGVRSKNIPCNAEHEREKGAIGWIDLNKENPVYTVNKTVTNSIGQEESRTVLMGCVALNSYGYSLLVDNRFKFWSAEIWPRWKSKEVNLMTTDGDTSVEVQAQTSTPVLAGGAVTNDPFIEGMEMIGFSNGILPNTSKEVVYSLDSNSDDYYVFSYHGKSADQVIEDKIEDEVSDFSQPIPHFVDKKDSVVKTDLPDVDKSNHSSKGASMKFSDVLNKINSLPLAEKLSYLDSVNHEFSASDENLIFSAYHSALRDQDEKSRLANEAERLKSLAIKDKEELQAKNTKLGLSLIEAKQQSYSNAVDAFEQKHIAAGIYPSVINAAKTLLSSMTVESRDQRFSCSSGSEASSVNMLEVLEQVFAAVPAEGRSTHMKTEITKSDIEAVAPKDEAVVAPVTENKSSDDSGVPAHVLAFSQTKQGKMMPWIVEPQYWGQVSEDGQFDLGAAFGLGDSK